MIGSKIGERIGLLRGDKSQEELGEALEVSRETIKHWENGTRQIKAADLVKIAQYFNVSTDYLLGLTDIRSPDLTGRAVCEYTGLTEKSVKYLHDGQSGKRFFPFSTESIGTLSGFIEFPASNVFFCSLLELKGIIETMKYEIQISLDHFDPADREALFELVDNIEAVRKDLVIRKFDITECMNAFIEYYTGYSAFKAMIERTSKDMIEEFL